MSPDAASSTNQLLKRWIFPPRTKVRVNASRRRTAQESQWIKFLTREALDPKGEFVSEKEERQKLIRSFAENKGATSQRLCGQEPRPRAAEILERPLNELGHKLEEPKD
jgi:hypothetical protein